DVVDRYDGETSLREAVNYANAHPGPDTILFEKKVRYSSLTLGTLSITDSSGATTIEGETDIRIGRPYYASAFGIFQVSSGATAVLNHLTVVTGSSSFGGGGVLNDGTLIVNFSTFEQNTTSGKGGAIHNRGSLIVSN